MREQVFTSEIIHTLRHDSHYVYKIPDAPLSEGMNLGFAMAKPCDLVASVLGKFVAIETKQMKKFRAFGLYDMRPSQIKHLTEMVEKGARAFVFLNVRINPAEGSKRENRLIVFDWKALHEVFKEGSIKAKDVMALAYTEKSAPIKVSPKKKINGVFDLSLFYALLNEEIITDEDF